MDADRFDILTRALTGATSRRHLLAGLAGSALGALAVALGFAETGATHYGCLHVGRRCRRNSQCCSSRCRGRKGEETCRAHHAGTCTAAKAACNGNPFGCGGGNCACFRTTGGANFCSALGGGVCMTCTKDAQCVTALDTPGSACVDINHGECTGGCNGFTTGCMPPCPA